MELEILKLRCEDAIMSQVDSNRTRMDSLLTTLLSAREYRFNRDLEAALPEKRGVYAISVGKEGDTRFVYVGMTPRSKRGLRRRIYEDHFTNPTSGSDLPNVLMRANHWGSRKSTRIWIEENCVVRWMEIEDERTRAFLEGYATAILQPDPTI